MIPDGDLDPLPEDAPRSPAEAFAMGGRFTFSVENLNSNAPLDVPLPNAIPIGQKLAIELHVISIPARVCGRADELRLVGSARTATEMARVGGRQLTGAHLLIKKV